MFKKWVLFLCVLICSTWLAALFGCESALNMLGVGQASLTIGTLAVPNLPIGSTEVVTISAKSASGDAESFSATSDDETVATLSKGANSITLTGATAGKAIIKVVSASNKTGYIDVTVVWPRPKPGVAPSVLSVAPLADATAVPTTAKVSAVFAATMDAATITTANFTLTGPSTTPVAGTVVWNASLNSAIFTPNASLAAGTLFTAKVSTAVKDSSGTALAAEKIWTFTTAGTPVVPSPVPGTPPTVSSVLPLHTATGVAATATVSAVFSTTMDAATMTTANFTLVGPALVHVVGTVAWNAATNTVTFTPSAPLAAGTQYTAKISTAVKDSSGTAMAAYKVWSFTTASTAEPPTVISTSPTSGAAGVETTAWVKATFSAAMDAATINGNTFMVFLSPGNTFVGGTVTYDEGTKKASFSPSAALLASSTYNVKITSAVKNSAGTAMAADKTWSFTTAAATFASPGGLNIRKGLFLVNEMQPSKMSYIYIDSSNNLYSKESGNSGATWSASYSIDTTASVYDAVADIDDTGDTVVLWIAGQNFSPFDVKARYSKKAFGAESWEAYQVDATTTTGSIFSPSVFRASSSVLLFAAGYGPVADATQTVYIKWDGSSFGFPTKPPIVPGTDNVVGQQIYGDASGNVNYLYCDNHFSWNGYSEIFSIPGTSFGNWAPENVLLSAVNASQPYVIKRDTEFFLFYTLSDNSLNFRYHTSLPSIGSAVQKVVSSAAALPNYGEKLTRTMYAAKDTGQNLHIVWQDSSSNIYRVKISAGAYTASAPVLVKTNTALDWISLNKEGDDIVLYVASHETADNTGSVTRIINP